MHQSTIAEVLGFDLFASAKHSVSRDGIQRFSYVESNQKIGFERLYHSCRNSTGMQTIYAPGMMYLLGNKYVVLKCPEIEQHLYRSLSYSKYNMGLAKLRLNSYGYNDEKTSFLKVPTREFHPIGKLSKMTLRFETNTGELYDFKGVNHNIVFALYYYEPKQLNKVTISKLNPDYNPDFVKYLRSQDDQQEESNDSEDDENDLSRDNIQIYKKRELEYNARGIENRNNVIVMRKKQQYDNDQNLQQRVRNFIAQKNSNASNASNASNESSDNNSSESDNGNNSNNSNDSNTSNSDYESE
jgi:hypothetical protein